MASGHNVFSVIGRACLANVNALEPPAAGGVIPNGDKSLWRLTLTATGAYMLQSCPGSIGLVTTDDASDVTLKNQAGSTFASLSGASGANAVIVMGTADDTWVAIPAAQFTSLAAQGFIPLPLDGWREIVSNDIINAAGNGGVLATDTTPAYETTNGDTDGQLRIYWASSNSDPIARSIQLPPDLDRTKDIVINLRLKMSGGDDTPAIDCDSFFDEGDTKVEDASTTSVGTTASVQTITIAAADIPSSAQTLSIELTPGTHTNDGISLLSSYITYTKKSV